MSRRHRGRPHHHAPAGPEGARRGLTSDPVRPEVPDTTLPRTSAAAPPRPAGTVDTSVRHGSEPGGGTSSQVGSATAAHDRVPAQTSGDAAPSTVDARLEPTSIAAGQPVQAQNGDRSGQCTAPQLRRFIKSRPYVPMHELRRRFSINGHDDDVTPVRMNPGWIYVGLPNHEGHLLGDLLRTGEIGYELSLDPRTPIVIGVYPMRPIPRT